MSEIELIKSKKEKIIEQLNKELKKKLLLLENKKLTGLLTDEVCNEKKKKILSQYNDEKMELEKVCELVIAEKKIETYKNKISFLRTTLTEEILKKPIYSEIYPQGKNPIPIEIDSDDDGINDLENNILNSIKIEECTETLSMLLAYNKITISTNVKKIREKYITNDYIDKIFDSQVQHRFELIKNIGKPEYNDVYEKYKSVLYDYEIKFYFGLKTNSNII